MGSSSFDWVRARAACSPWKVFKELEQGVRDDVDAINSQRKPEDAFKYTVAKAGENHFSVLCEGVRRRGSVDFVLSDDEIIVGNGESVIFKATLTLSNKGLCRLKVNDEELEQWQFRKRALEGLFFKTSI